MQQTKYKQPTAKPTRKVKAVGVGGAVAVLLTATLNNFGVPVSAEIASALTTVLAFVFGYVFFENAQV